MSEAASVGDERRRTEMALLQAIRQEAQAGPQEERQDIAVAADYLAALAQALAAVQQPWVQRGQSR